MPVIGPLVFIRQFRAWAAAREAGESPLPLMQARLAPFEHAAQLAVACASLFELVEAHLARRLVPECCCSQALSRDEEALLGVLRHAPEAGQPETTAAVPHGLPGAIRWAAFAVRAALDEDPAVGIGAVAAPPAERCPFGREPRLVVSR